MEPQDDSNLITPNTSPTPSAVPTSPTTNQPITPSPITTNNVTGQLPPNSNPSLQPLPPKKDNKKLLILIGIVITIFVCVGLFFAVKSMGSYNATDPTKVPENTSDIKTPSSNNPGDSTGDNKSLDDRADDTERQADIKTIHGNFESYFAQNGKYPTLSNMNDTTWISANMKGLLDTEALKDPQGSTTKLATKPTKNQYSYEVLPANCNNTDKDCTSYKLTATLSDSKTYVKSSLN